MINELEVKSMFIFVYASVKKSQNTHTQKLTKIRLPPPPPPPPQLPTDVSNTKVLGHVHTLETKCRDGEDPVEVLKYMSDIAPITSSAQYHTNATEIFRYCKLLPLLCKRYKNCIAM